VSDEPGPRQRSRLSATARKIPAAHLTARGRMTSTAQLENRTLRDEG